MRKRNKEEISFINTNARSLCPKIHSLIDAFDELQLTFATITETWLADGESLEEDLSDLALGAGIKVLYRNRTLDSRLSPYGGVALAYRGDMADFRSVVRPNPDNFEVMSSVGSIRGHSRKFVVVSLYIPPGYSVSRGKACLEYITDTVVEIKRRYTDPYVIVIGDSNQWDLGGALEEFPEIGEAHHLNTRGNRSIDRIFLNFTEKITSVNTLPPLESDDASKKSDHLVVLVEATLPRVEAFEVLRYSYYYFTEESASNFTSWIVKHDWSEVLTAPESNAKVAAYQAAIDMAIASFFKLITTTRK